LEAAREIKEIVDKQLEDKEWQTFVKDKLALDNDKMQLVLGGHRPGDQQQQQPAPVPAPPEEFEVRQGGGLEQDGFEGEFPFPNDDDDEDDELFNFDDPENDDKPTT